MYDKVYGACLTAQAVFTAIQPSQILQWISLSITIVSALVGLIFKIVQWYKKAKEDKKIDINEIESAVNILNDGVEEIKDALENIENNKEE